VTEGPDDRQAERASCCLASTADAPPPRQDGNHKEGQSTHLKMLPLLLLLRCLSLLFFNSKSLTRKVGQTDVLSLRSALALQLRAVLCTRLRWALSGCL